MQLTSQTSGTATRWKSPRITFISELTSHLFLKESRLGCITLLKIQLFRVAGHFYNVKVTRSRRRYLLERLCWNRASPDFRRGSLCGWHQRNDPCQRNEIHLKTERFKIFLAIYSFKWHHAWATVTACIKPASLTPHPPPHTHIPTYLLQARSICCFVNSCVDIFLT